MADEALSDEPVGPAIITPLHTQDRTLATRAGAKMGWTKLSIHEQEWKLGHLACPERLKSPQTAKDEAGRAFDRAEAAHAFAEGWLVCNASWPSGSDLNRVRVAGCPGSFVDHQRDVKDFWRRVEKAMGGNDWMICRRVIGEGYELHTTILTIQPAYKHTVRARFRESLDALIEGMKEARKK